MSFEFLEDTGSCVRKLSMAVYVESKAGHGEEVLDREPGGGDRHCEKADIAESKIKLRALDSTNVVPLSDVSISSAKFESKVKCI